MGTDGQIAPVTRVRRVETRLVFSPTLTATIAVATPLVTTVWVRVATRRRVVANSGGAVMENAPELLDVVVATCAHCPWKG